MTKAVWKVSKAKPEDVRPLVEAGMLPPVAAVMAARGMGREEVRRYLEPSLTGEMPKVEDLPGITQAAAYLAGSIMSGRRIGIWTDYDCDGATSGAVLSEFLGMCGREAWRIHSPDRILEGYGPNRAGLERLFDEGVESMFVLDSGTVATNVFDPMSEAHRRNIVVIDHHLPGETLPQIRAVVNPNRNDIPEERRKFGQMCAAGVTFVTCLAALKVLNASKHPWPGGREPHMPDLLDLVAIGTVADVVPLTGVNRAFVRRGLDLMENKRRPSVQALMDVAKAKKIGTYEIGFVIGPRINAAGRIGDSTAGVRFLIERDPKKLTRMAESLDKTNTERKRLEREATENVVAKVEAKFSAGGDGPDYSDRGVIVEVAEGAHVGVVGISAARVKDRMLRPSIIVTEVPCDDGTILLKGSARSIEGFSVGEAIHDAADLGLIVQGGGHAMAGGVTLRPDQIDAFRTYMSERSLESDFGREGPVEVFDAVIRPEHVREELVRAFETMQPCGTGNPEPRLMMRDVVATDVKLVGKDPAKRHISFVARTPGGKSGCDCMLFNVDVSGNGPDEEAIRSGRPFSMSGSMSLDVWRDAVQIKFMVRKVSTGPDPEPAAAPERAQGAEP